MSSIGVGNINVNNQNVTTVPYIKNNDNDFSIADENSYAIVSFENGHIKTKNFDSKNIPDVSTTPFIENSDMDLEISDEHFNSIVIFNDGEVKTKNFDSRNLKTGSINEDFTISDEDSNDIVQFKDGHIKTKNFDSRYIESNVNPVLLHIILTGQSLAVGYNTGRVLNRPITSRALMFSRVKTYDFGYNYGITYAQYNTNPDYYDDLFYQLRELIEEGGYGNNQTIWATGMSGNEFETPCSGIIEGILNGYKKQGFNDIPFYTLSTDSGVGATGVVQFQPGRDIFERTKKDIRHGIKIADKLGLSYMPVMVWIQGEHDSRAMSIADYKTYLTNYYNSIKGVLESYGTDVSRLKMFCYQPNVRNNENDPTHGSASSLAIMELNNETTWCKITTPTYSLPHANDYVHLTNLGSRELGNIIGNSIFKNLYSGSYETLKIASAYINQNKITVVLNKEVVIDSEHVRNTGGYTQEQNEWRTASFGFRALTSNNVDVFVSAQQTNETSIELTISEPAVSVAYGFMPPLGTAVGGCVREKESVLGYNNSETYRYMPIQQIEVTTRHQFSESF